VDNEKPAPRGTDAPAKLSAYARLAGLGYLIIIGTGLFAEFFVRSSLIVPGDAAATAVNIMNSEVLFRSGLGSEFIMLIVDVLLAFFLYVIFRPVHRHLALLAAFFRLAHASIVGVNLLNMYLPLLFLAQADFLTAFDPAQLQALGLVFLQAHSFGYVIGLVFFGVHCLVLGYLVVRSGFLPRVLGVLLFVAGVGYLIDSFGRALLPNYQEYEMILGMVVLLPALVGELSFSLWLLIKGVDERASVPGSV